MPVSCTTVTIEEVLNFFTHKIDGLGIKSGFLRNAGVPESLKRKKHWNFCLLDREEFMGLEIPDGTKTLIKDKKYSTFDPGLKKDVDSRLINLNSNPSFPALILRKRIPSDSPNSTYFIEDGAHRAIAYKVYLETHEYRPVEAYIGSNPFTE